MVLPDREFVLQCSQLRPLSHTHEECAFEFVTAMLTGSSRKIAQGGVEQAESIGVCNAVQETELPGELRT